VQELSDPAVFQANLSKITYYSTYRVFFQKEIEERGLEYVVNEYVLKGDERANIMFARLYAGRPLLPRKSCNKYLMTFTGTLHPLIHFGFGVEFTQPAIVIEALAQIAIHPTWLDSFFFEVEAKAKRSNTPSKSLVDILDEIRADENLRTAARWSDQNQIRDGVLARAKDAMVKYASQWRVDPDNLEAAIAEMVNAAGKCLLPCHLLKVYVLPSIGSLLHWWRPTSSKANQIRLLFHPLCQQLHILLFVSEAVLDQYSKQSKDAGVQSQDGYVPVRFTAIADASAQ